MITGFFYPKVVETSMSFKDLLAALQNSSYGWSPADAVELKFFSSTEQKFLPLTCDEHLGLLFTLNAERRFGKILIEVLQPHNEHDKGKDVQKSSVSTNSEHPGTPCRSKPSKASGSESHNMSSTASSGASPVAIAADVH